MNAALDQFHTRGLAATANLAKLVGITAVMSVWTLAPESEVLRAI
jgi:hypothetical protein